MANSEQRINDIKALLGVKRQLLQQAQATVDELERMLVEAQEPPYTFNDHQKEQESIGAA